MDVNPYESPEFASDPPPALSFVVPVRRTAARGAIWGAASFGLAGVVSVWWLTSDANFRGGDRLAQLAMLVRGLAIGAIFGAIVGASIQGVVNMLHRLGKRPTKGSK